MTLKAPKYTLSQVRTDVSIRMDDSSDVRWTAAQKNLAITSAIRKAAGQWWEERIDDSNTYVTTTYRYALPPACKSVECVHFAGATTTVPRIWASPTRWHIEEDYLVFDQAMTIGNNRTMYITYLVYQANLNGTIHTDGVAATTVISSATATFVTDGIQIGDEVEVDSDSASPYYVASVDSNTQLGLHKTPTAGTGLTFWVAHYTDMPYEYLVYGAMAELYEMASRNRPGVEVEEQIRWATYYRQMAASELKAHRKHTNPQRRF